MGPRVVLLGVALSLVLASALGFAMWAGEDPAPVTPQSPVAQPSRPPPPPPREEFDSPPDLPPVPSVAQPTPAAPPPPIVPMPRWQKQPVDPEAFARETVLIDRARAEVKTNPETALKSLIEYQQLFPQGERGRDMQLVELEALLRLGRRQEADELVRKVTSQDPAMTKPVQKVMNSARPR